MQSVIFFHLKSNFISPWRRDVIFCLHWRCEDMTCACVIMSSCVTCVTLPMRVFKTGAPLISPSPCQCHWAWHLWSAPDCGRTFHWLPKASVAATLVLSFGRFILRILGAQLPQVVHIRHFGRFDPGWKKVSQETRPQISRKISVSSMHLFENRPERLL